MLLSLQSAFGIAVIVGIAWTLSERRRDIRWRAIGFGLLLQALLAVLLTQVPPVRDAFAQLNGVVIALNEATRAGTAFVFGYLGGADAPFPTTGSGSNFVFAFQSLPLLLIIGALSALLFYWNIIPPIVRAFAWVLRRATGVDGPAGFGIVVTIFIGNVEGPLVVRPYLAAESRAGLFVLMTAGMAMISGTMMVIYATMLSDAIANPLGQLLTASILAAPGTVAVAFLMVPESPELAAGRRDEAPVMVSRQPGDNAIAVITRGAIDMVPLIFNIVAMLIVLIALVTLVNMAIAHLPDVFGAPLTLQRLFGWVMAPLAWLIGIPWSEAPAAGALLGTKTVLNELVAYSDLAHLGSDVLAPRSRLIMTYALCGFANFASMGITIGGLGAMIPDRRAEIVALTPKALISGTLTTCLSGAMIGLLTPV